MWLRNRVWIIGTVGLWAAAFASPRIGWLSSLSLLAVVGMVLLVLTVVPNNVVRLGLVPAQQLARVVRHRRSIGILGGIAVTSHAALALWFSGFDFRVFLLPSIVPAALALVIVVAMLVTSNRWIKTKMAMRWKSLQSLVWIALPLGAVHGMYAGGGLVSRLSWVPLGVLVLVVGWAVVEYALVHKRKVTDPITVRHFRYVVGSALAGLAWWYFTW